MSSKIATTSRSVANASIRTVYIDGRIRTTLRCRVRPFHAVVTTCGRRKRQERNSKARSIVPEQVNVAVLETHTRKVMCARSASGTVIFLEGSIELCEFADHEAEHKRFCQRQVVWIGTQPRV